jgi:hypothetical protein
VCTTSVEPKIAVNQSIATSVDWFVMMIWSFRYRSYVASRHGLFLL